MRGHLRVASDDPERDVARFITALSSRLRSINVGRTQTRLDTIDVEVDTLRLSFTWLHPFKGVSSAKFRAVAERTAVRIDYDIGVTGMVLGFVVFAVVVVVYSLRFPPTPWNFAGPPAFIALVLLLNLVIVHVQVRRILHEVAKGVAKEALGTEAG